MGITKWITRKGAVGETARWVAQAFLYALSQQFFDPQNCKTREGMRAELEKIVGYALQVRFENDPNNPDLAQIVHLYETSERGLDMFCVAILIVQGGLDASPDLMDTNMAVIHEEMQSAGVGDAFIFGRSL